MSKVQRSTAVYSAAIPPEVLAAQAISWGVVIDAFLTSAAKVGSRYSASAFLDRSGLITNGSTVATPEVKAVDKKLGFVLLQTLCGNDHYVVASWLSDRELPNADL